MSKINYFIQFETVGNRIFEKERLDNKVYDRILIKLEDFLKLQKESCNEVNQYFILYKQGKDFQGDRIEKCRITEESYNDITEYLSNGNIKEKDREGFEANTIH